MSKLSLSLVAAVIAATSSIGAQQGGGARPGPVPSIEDRTAGLRKIDGYVPLYWDERAGAMLLEMPQARHRVPDVDGAVGRARLERPRPRPRPGRPGPHRHVPARRPARAAGAAQPVVPIEQSQRARAQVGRGLLRQVGAVGLRGGGRVRRPRARRCDRLLPARRARRRRRPAARQLPRRPLAQRLLPAQHQGLPEEHRSGRAADLRQRARWRSAAASGPQQGPAADRRRPAAAAAAAASAATSSAARSAASRPPPTR